MRPEGATRWAGYLIPGQGGCAGQSHSPVSRGTSLGARNVFRDRLIGFGARLATELGEEQAEYVKAGVTSWGRVEQAPAVTATECVNDASGLSTERTHMGNGQWQYRA